MLASVVSEKVHVILEPERTHQKKAYGAFYKKKKGIGYSSLVRTVDQQSMDMLFN